MKNSSNKTFLLLVLVVSTLSIKQIHDLVPTQIKQSHLEQSSTRAHKGLGLRRQAPNQSHKYWFNKNHPTDSILSSARQWNYCDYKCLYLQKYNTNKDFVVVVMGAFLKQDFSACYVKNGKDYTLWNQIMTNKFYEENCGKDETDWMKSGKFDVKGIYGVGIGTNLNEAEIYQ